MEIVYLALAGAAGAVARWGFSGGMVRLFGPAFPLGTLGENLIGCFLIGVVMQLAERTTLLSVEARTVIAVGFIGTFTTFSTFEYETLRLARHGEAWAAGLNLALNMVLGLALVWAGMALTADVLAHGRRAPVAPSAAMTARAGHDAWVQPLDEPEVEAGLADRG